MTRKRIGLYVIVAVVVMAAVLAGYYIWQKRDIRPPQGTLVENRPLMERFETDAKEEAKS